MQTLGTQTLFGQTPIRYGDGMHHRLIFRPGIFAFYGHGINATGHSHRAVQLVLPDPPDAAPATIIASQQPHSLTLAAGWVVLIEPQCDLAQALTGADHERQQAALQQLSGQLQQPHQWHPGQTLDPRLQRLLQQLDGCLNDDCLKPDHWRAADVAAQLALSESRFLHLFRAQMGVAWRPYLLWRRLLCAVRRMSQGCSATDAAHQAGFSDSAHLSRTFRSTFGMTIRQASQLLAA